MSLPRPPLEQAGQSNPEDCRHYTDPPGDCDLEGPEIVRSRVISGLDRDPPNHRECKAGRHGEYGYPLPLSKQVSRDQASDRPEQELGRSRRIFRHAYLPVGDGPEGQAAGQHPGEH